MALCPNNHASLSTDFCSVCGVKSFYIPRSHPDGVSVNARCIDSGTIESMSVTPFNGREWEKGRAEYHDAPVT